MGERIASLDDFIGYFHVGDIYLDVFDHPVLCMQVHIEEEDILLEGISLYDGTYPRGCSVMHSAPDKIDPETAWEMKLLYEKQKRPKV